MLVFGPSHGNRALTARGSFCVADAPAAETATGRSSWVDKTWSMMRRSLWEVNIVAQDTKRSILKYPVGVV